MPLVGLRPTVARLVVEDSKDTVLVMKVVTETDDQVELTTGGVLGELQGVLRIRERSREARNGTNAIGAMVYVPGDGEVAAAAKFQVNISMAAEKFAVLLRLCTAGRLPAKFLVDAGGRSEPGETSPLGFRVRAGNRIKVWDNHVHRTLLITNFVMILPIELPVSALPAAAPEAVSTVPVSARIADLADDMLVFQSDTRNTMFGLVCVLAIVALAALALAVALFLR